MDNPMTDARAFAIRVAIIDDDPFVRTSLSTILTAQDDIVVCGEGGDGFEAQKLFDQVHPDVLLMDIQMPRCTGLEAAESIIGNDPTARVVFLTTFSDDEYIVSALRLGARGYLVKQEVVTIAPALRSVMSGQMVLGGEVVAKVDALVGAPVRAPSTPDPGKKRALGAGLSEREFEIIELIAEGLDNKEVAGSLYISEGTVRNHVSAILQKLGLRNRTQLAVYYYRHLSP